MEAELAVMRQRVDGLEEDLDRQRQKAITATEAYQKMVVDLQVCLPSTFRCSPRDPASTYEPGCFCMRWRANLSSGGRAASAREHGVGARARAQGGRQARRVPGPVR